MLGVGGCCFGMLKGLDCGFRSGCWWVLICMLVDVYSEGVEGVFSMERETGARRSCLFYKRLPACVWNKSRIRSH